MDRGPFDHLEDDHDAAGNRLDLRRDIDELAAFDEPPNIVLDQLRVVGLAGAGHQRR